MILYSSFKLRPSDVLNVHTISGLLQLEDPSYYNLIQHYNNYTIAYNYMQAVVSAWCIQLYTPSWNKALHILIINIIICKLLFWQYTKPDQECNCI